MKEFKRMKKRKITALLALTVIYIFAVLTFPVSFAKYAARHEYRLKLAMATHYTFSAGTSHSFEIPEDGYYAFQLWGARGGDGRSGGWSGNNTYPIGGEGGEVAAVSYFFKGTVLDIVVGTKGGTTDGGFNGGGDGGYHSPIVVNSFSGGGGGGATDIRPSGGSLSDRILVAGGGGGASGGGGALSGNYSPAAGGSGGNAESHYVGENGSGEGGGIGGGAQSENSLVPGQGGTGNYSGGGGGGGYYGGDGSSGSGGGGGGGSSYIDSIFEWDAPSGLPKRDFYEAGSDDGYAIVSYLGPT